MASSGFYDFLETTGTITPNTTTLMSEVQGEYQNAFGQNLILDASTPQGVLINAEILARTRVLQINSSVANQINPNLAGGIFLDAILALTGATRTFQQYTSVIVTVTGAEGIVIPVGSQVQDTLGNIYEIQNTTTIPTGGTTTATVNAVVAGPLTVAVGAITIILSNILGWETVYNYSVQTVVGQTTQSDQAARIVRQNTLALQGQSVSQAITSGVYAIAGVTSLFYQQNDTASPTTINGVPMVANSLYICVAGGDPMAIAYELNQKKSAGCNYNNAVVYSSTLVGPATATTVGSFTVANCVTIGPITITGGIVQNNNVISTSNTSGVFVGQGISGSGIPVGATVTSFIANTSVTMNVNALATTSGSWVFSGSTVVTMPSTSYLFVGQTITGAGIPAGTVISALTAPFVPNTSFTMSNPATASGTVTLTMGNTPYISTFSPGLVLNTNVLIGSGISDFAGSIPVGSTVVAVLDSTDLQISNLVTATSTGDVITIYGGVPQNISITDPYSFQTITVSFDTPTFLPIAVKVTVHANSSIVDIVSTIQNAVVAYANGQILGDPGLQIGTSVSPFAIAGAINIAAPSIYITKVEISLFPISYSTSSIPVAVFQQATISPSSVVVVFG